MSQNNIIDIDILLEYLEIALHNTLYYRHLYPKQIFIKKKIYGTCVYMLQHKKLNDYIKNILLYVKEVINNNESNLKSVNLLYFNKYNTPIEKFIFHLNQLEINKLKADLYFITIEKEIRTLCLHLSTLEIYLNPLPANSSFIINISTNHSTYTSFTENSKCHDFTWIIENNFKEVYDGLLLPINGFGSKYLNLQLYIIENQSKVVY